jgi:ubiquinone/menaquinone biosynthesis C-methylase UbiE
MSISAEYQLLILFAFLFGFILFLFLFFIRKEKKNDILQFTHSSKDVQRFYNETTDKFIAVYGEIIQAFRTKNVIQYLEYTADVIGLESMSKVVDAGCGIGGPAVHFATQFPSLQINALTISEVQIEKARQTISEKKLENRIHLHHADYHLMASILEKSTFDAVYFLESFGHSPHQVELIEEALQLLKPGGRLYIKDLFKRECSLIWEQERVDEICDEINKAYHYKIPQLHTVLSTLRKNGMILKKVGVPNVKTDDFENLTISNDFQELFDIGKVGSWDDYIFPIDFYEILAEKPLLNDRSKLHLYVLNNLKK